MAVVVVDEAEFCVVELAGPLDSLLYITFCRYLAVGGVGVGGADVAVLAADFANVLSEIPAVSEPGAVLLDGQRAGGYGLGRIPGDEPQGRVVAAGEIDAGYLEIAAVDVALLKRDIVAYGDHLRGAAPHVVVLAMHGGAARGIDPVEIDGAVLGVVVHCSDTGAGLHTGLVTIRIKIKTLAEFMNRKPFFSSDTANISYGSVWRYDKANPVLYTKSHY